MEQGERRVGCAGWSIPREAAGAFPAGGSHLERYAEVFNAVEINSSFYRPHREQRLQRFAAEVAGLGGKLGCVLVQLPPKFAYEDALAGGFFARLHGNPRIYYSSYEPDYLRQLRCDMATHAAAGRTAWTIFDNTAAGAAVPNALSLLA
ncbi:MAG TPA: DUF72 domain-containing protein [Telluria sp.]|nr:DUF72 domain-containing protein [Telluria sp.]